MKKFLVLLLVLALTLGVATAGCLNGYDELDYEDFEFTDENYEETVDPEFGPEETIYMSFVAYGFEADEDQYIEYSMYMTIENPDGEIYDGIDEYRFWDEQRDHIGGDWGEVELQATAGPEYEDMPFETWDEGENTITFKIIDHIGDKDLEFTKTFTVTNT
ncbi:hypothetical protein AMET1_1352 [Methanonatronarchaeum thermophilum]|uniref:Uncharacterized protein n=1 Tax=Methanonatronarchaeum thermophilum TaxID=1927129 RepID=A0A1Y3GGD3_9EURY|nr:hypothetical protein [Methanonatronarchaeum thermophilum]OUJ18436.1 hypothetical protein AMET1_1352 [Methanonatronarchaeum thermophilum]